MALPAVTVIGRMTADPELRFTPQGKAVASFTVAASERRKNQQTDQWEDGDKSFLRCSCWEQVAENVAESLTKGLEVIVVGKYFQREYTTSEGVQRTSNELKVDAVGAVVGRQSTVRVNKLARGAHSSSDTPRDDPWSSGAAASGPDDPPF